MKDAICITLESRAVAASTGRLFQLAVVRGRKRKELHCLVIAGAEKLDGGCGESVSQTA